jgi:hypothetical protein
MIISGLMRGGSGTAAPRAPQPAPAPDQGGGLIDILRQIFTQGQQGQGGAPTGAPGSSPYGIPPIGDILGTPQQEVPNTPQRVPEAPRPADRPSPVPTDSGGGAAPDGDLLGHILRELEKGIREGRVKPVIVGPYEIDLPGQSAPAGPNQQQTPGGDILGQILREVLGGKGGQVRMPGQASGLGSAVFGDRIEVGRDVDQSQIDSMQEVFDRYLGGRQR